MFRTIASGVMLMALPSVAVAQEQTVVAANETGDTAWVLAASALLLFAILPGLVLFFAGQVRSRNLLSVATQIGTVTAIVSLLWVVVGYTLAFGDSVGGFLGNGRAWMLIQLDNLRANTIIPESTFALFRMGFAVLASALMVGAWLERASFGWVVAFTAIWTLLVFAPVAHWVWGGGWLAGFGVLDFGGGLAVLTTAGASSLVVALLMGKRLGFTPAGVATGMPLATVTGALLLWVGWFGLSGGSTLTATDDASSAIINTHVAAAAAALVWLMAEKASRGVPTAVGFATGLAAGLATVTPAAGYISPGASIAFGAAGALVCFWAVNLVRSKWGIDDSANIFAVFGVGGMLGTLLLAPFLSIDLGGTGYADEVNMAGMIVAQALGVGAVAIYSAIATGIIAVAVSLFIPMRVSEAEETAGLDNTGHAERAKPAA